MHRRFLLDQLAEYLLRFPDEKACVERTRTFVQQRPDCFLRRCEPGHVTGSAWLVSLPDARALLVHHRKLGRWLQPGGHCDGEPEVHRTALREAQEESGMWQVRLLDRARIVPLDVDVHAIPAHGDEPKHLHYDIRYLIVAAPGQQPRPAQSEVRAARWFAAVELAAVTGESSVLRMQRKAAAVLTAGGTAMSW